MPSPILARADALMHRKRQNEVDFDDVPVLTDAIDDDDDIPVLLEVAPSAPQEAELVSPAPAEMPQPEADTTPGITVAAGDEPAPACAILAPDAGLREQLASELARRVELRLAAELPRIIESTLRDFLAEQEMIAAASRRD